MRLCVECIYRWLMRLQLSGDVELMPPSISIWFRASDTNKHTDTLIHAHHNHHHWSAKPSGASNDCHLGSEWIVYQRHAITSYLFWCLCMTKWVLPFVLMFSPFLYQSRDELVIAVPVASSESLITSRDTSFCSLSSIKVPSMSSTCALVEAITQLLWVNYH